MKQLSHSSMRHTYKVFLIALGASIAYLLVYLFVHILKDKYLIALDTTGSTQQKAFVVKKENPADLTINNQEFIAFRFKHENDPYYEQGHNFIKRVACKEGDILSVDKRSFYCNGEYIGFGKEHDSQNKPVDIFSFEGVIPKDQYFVMGDAVMHSYDSRYWGFVDKNQIIGKAIW